MRTSATSSFSSRRRPLASQPDCSRRAVSGNRASGSLQWMDHAARPREQRALCSHDARARQGSPSSCSTGLSRRLRPSTRA
eukprot:9335171-Pyramimonas_sp.AAC.1